MIKLLFLFTFFVLQDTHEKISVSAQISQTEMKIGDKIEYSIIIDYDKNLKIETPGAAINLGYFEIKDYKIHPPKESNGRITERYDYTISTYDTGKYIIPPFPVAYYETANKSDFNYIEAPEQHLYVASIFLNDSVLNAEPKPIKGIKFLPKKDSVWLWVLFGVALLLVAGVLIWYFKFRKTIAEEEIVTPLSAHEKALKLLGKHREFHSEEMYEINKYYTSLSLILRQYLEGRYNFPAAEQTTEELRKSLRKTELTSSDYEEIIELIGKADMVKFANERPEISDFKLTFEAIESVIIRTKPLDIPEESTVE